MASGRDTPKASSLSTINIDYDHKSMNDVAAGENPAAGWVQKLEKREDGLWAYVEWTGKAAEYIRNGEYRYCSPVVDWKAKDRKSNKSIGVELYNIALTNQPFLDGQTPITLSRVQMADEQVTEETTALQEGEEEVTTEGDANAVVGMIAETANLELSAAIAAMADRIEEIAALIAGTNEEDGTEAEGEEGEGEEGEAMAASRIESAKGDQVTLMAKRLNELEAKEAARVEKAADERIAYGLKEGYMVDAQAEKAKEIYIKDGADVFENIYMMAKVVPVGERQAGAEPPKGKTAMSKDTLTGADLVSFKNLTMSGQFTDKQALEQIAKYNEEN
jgi:phage I-like protein